jgi:hypothetical protein
MTEQNINSDFVIEILDNLSLRITKFTFVVLDNARIHTARKVKQLSRFGNKEVYLFFTYLLTRLISILLKGFGKK